MKRNLTILLLILFAGILLALAAGFTYGAPLASDMDDYFIHFGQAQIATNNIVTTIVFDYRGFDTLGESTVLFTAVIGVSLMFRQFFGVKTMQMSKIVRLSADIMYPFVVIFGLYVIMHGHITPGGGFQGGAVVATGAALVIVAYAFGDVKSMIPKILLYLQESGGLLLFIGAGLGGMVLGFPFFFNWLANSGSLFGMPVPIGPNPGELNTAGFLPLMNIAVGIEVWGGLTLVILYMLSGVGKEGY